jgi:16S rRNA (cytosine1402-N4)-methyltransferase
MRGVELEQGDEVTGQVASPAPHEPVMVASVLAHLAPQPGGIIVDGTAGAGGHTRAILPRVLPKGRVIALDRDPEALAYARQRVVEFEPQVTCVQENFRNLAGVLADLRVQGVDGILLDLGMSSMQVDQAQRGFSFMKAGPLDMRMDAAQRMTAEQLVNTLSASELEALILRFGDERFARQIARQIVLLRAAQPIRTTTELARAVTSAIPVRARHGRIHCATRTFQALRMAVNDEEGALEALLSEAPRLLNPGGRLVVIAFHSFEDRLVKRAFQAGARDGCWTVLTKHVARAGEDEVARNPRARSAKLRAVVRAHTAGAA